ncbi:MAG: HK97 family phage prohead protease [Brevundimonas sp.]|uniref:HK97 family phage prohead protease n=1 Tax=Brevundimonas sp. TaxID=1871086 RepID=UPI001209F7D1|nr:HK97 family phage prohead protease [Brevundimonas sp.]RZJ19116.1 MAG: HK97 family phage prohead protease [Brevundimonas sp.]
MTLETRALVGSLESRSSDDGARVGGLGITYNSATEIGDSFKEVFAPGAFSGSIASDVLAFFGHDRNRVLGRTTAGTLRLSEDERGVSYEIDLPDTSDGRDLAVSVGRGDIRGTSFGFRAIKETWDDTTEPPTRTIHKAELREISPTAQPAYGDTTIALRSLDAARKERRSHNFSHAARRLRMKVSLDLKGRE